MQGQLGVGDSYPGWPYALKKSCIRILPVKPKRRRYE